MVGVEEFGAADSRCLEQKVKRDGVLYATDSDSNSGDIGVTKEPLARSYLRREVGDVCHNVIKRGGSRAYVLPKPDYLGMALELGKHGRRRARKNEFVGKDIA